MFYDPILTAYEWTTPERVDRHSLLNLLDPSLWEDVASRAEVVSASPLVLEIVREARNGKKYAYRTECGQVGKALVPKRWSIFVLPERQPSTVCEVIEWTMASFGEGGEFPIPIRTSTTSSMVNRTVEIDRLTLQINHDVDPDVFTLSPAGMRRIVRDLDHVVPDHSMHRQLAKPPTGDHSGWQQLLLIANGGLVLLLVVIGLLRRRHSSG